MTAIDGSVFPDREPPSAFERDEDCADYIARICAAWDMGLLPEPGTLALFSGWRRIFDRFPIPSSPAYHAFRASFGWAQHPIEERVPLRPRWLVDDLAEGRPDTSSLL
uniref:Uncharacterized protein n=1 Tax=mine drainage metagenome TaxID=410659 RepID=E6Q5I5_9ZZZZ